MGEQTIIPPTGEIFKSGEPSYGAFLDRLIALIIDKFILYAIAFFLILPVVGLVLSLGSVISMPVVALGTGASPSVGLFIVALDWFYFAGFESGVRGATVGKRAMKLRVTDEAGGRLSFGKASLRYFSKILSALPAMLGFIMALFTNKKQALHDLIAGTIVIKV